MGQPENVVHHSAHILYPELSHMGAPSSKGHWEMEQLGAQEGKGHSWENHQTVSITVTYEEYYIAKLTKRVTSAEWQNGSTLEIVFQGSLKLKPLWRFCTEKSEDKDRY